jgi:hypothetical protein
MRKTDAPEMQQNWFNEYHRYEDIVGWFEYLEEEFDGLISVNSSIGQTFEGRNIMTATLTGNRSSVAGKKHIWLQGLVRD